MRTWKGKNTAVKAGRCWTLYDLSISQSTLNLAKETETDSYTEGKGGSKATPHSANGENLSLSYGTGLSVNIWK